MISKIIKIGLLRGIIVAVFTGNFLQYLKHLNLTAEVNFGLWYKFNTTGFFSHVL